MGKNNKRSPEKREEIRGKNVSSSLPSFGLAEDVLGPDFFKQKKMTEDTEKISENRNKVFHNDVMMKYGYSSNT